MILVFGATGYTGRLVVDSLVQRGQEIRIAGRSQERLEQLAHQHGGLDWVVADVQDPATVAAACDGVSAMVSTVGPFTWWGDVAAQAAIDCKVPYLDSTGEPTFVRRIFDYYGPLAAAAGIPMLTAFGHDYVPGNLAGGIALERAGDEATSVDIGYFISGARSPRSFSAGTLRSMRAASGGSGFAFRGGRIVSERAAKRVIKFDIRGKKAPAMSIGCSEHFSLPKQYPALQDVNVYLGWMGGLSYAISGMSQIQELAGSVPVIGGIGKRLANRSHTHETSGSEAPVGPSLESDRAKHATIIAIARDRNGNELARCDLGGSGMYEVTGKLLAWGAEQAAAGAITQSGALGPIDAFGLDVLRDYCASVGLAEKARS